MKVAPLTANVREAPENVTARLIPRSAPPAAGRPGAAGFESGCREVSRRGFVLGTSAVVGSVLGANI